MECKGAALDHLYKAKFKDLKWPSGDIFWGTSIIEFQLIINTAGHFRMIYHHSACKVTYKSCFDFLESLTFNIFDSFCNEETGLVSECLSVCMFGCVPSNDAN